MLKNSIIPKDLQGNYDNWHFSPAVQCEGFIFFSGCTGRRPDGTIADNVEDQARQVFLTIGKSIQEAEITFEHIVEMTTYHVGIQKSLEEFMRVKDEFIKEPYPAWTAIGVSELAVAEAVIEIRVIARQPTK
ncbi:RidA family protein [Kiloniella sp.]|uniref:RidA family protein n=1 Tax=Kiloniella sp. TaxID=1938587 RepID=UPI003B0164A8